MFDLIASLPPGARILDLGAASGSFHAEREDLCIVRVDLVVPYARKSGLYINADVGYLPFRLHSFDLVISNHSLEHFCDLYNALREIGRVIKRDGTLYITVPDSTTFTDRVYRWLARGGGHVNPFRSPEDVITPVWNLTRLQHRGTHLLFSSLSFLNAHNSVVPPPKRIALFGFGNERFLMVFTWVLRLIDRLLGTRLTHYGWAFYFGNVTDPQTSESWVNVCIRCGSGHPLKYLRTMGAVHRVMRLLELYRCPACGALNILTLD